MNYTISMTDILLAVSVGCNLWFLFLLLYERIMDTRIVRFFKGIVGLWRSLDGNEAKRIAAHEEVPAEKADIIGKSRFRMASTRTTAAIPTQEAATIEKGIELSEEEATFDDGKTGNASRPAQVPEEKLDETFTSIPPEELGYGDDEPEEDASDTPRASGSSFDEIDDACKTAKNPDATQAEREKAAKVFTDIEWQLTDDKGVPAVNAAMQPDGDVLTVTALGDGTLRVRALVRNGHDAPQLISQLELSISGVGQLHKNPYEFISASRFDASFGDIGNGNERGVSTSRTGRSWVLFDDIDFGPDGADTVELPIFVLDGEPTTFRFWDGEPYAEGSTMIGERVYHKPKQWNVYQPDTFKLDKLLRGIGRFAVELNVKVHIKGFIFTRHSRAWDTLAAGACDAVYGDSFTRDGSRVLGIGNNVSLLFDRMDFGETGCCGIRITGRSPLPANTVHLMFAAADGGETERRVVEFGPQTDWGEQTFTFEPVTGARQVTFLFLPGTQFDFDSFTFI